MVYKVAIQQIIEVPEGLSEVEIEEYIKKKLNIDKEEFIYCGEQHELFDFN
jgi:hypothetical protein